MQKIKSGDLVKWRSRAGKDLVGIVVDTKTFGFKSPARRKLVKVYTLEDSRVSETYYASHNFEVIGEINE